MIGLTKSYKTLIHRALYLNFKYEELEEIYDGARDLYYTEFDKYKKKNEIIGETIDDSVHFGESEKINDDIEMTESFKKFYRRITQRTHPDKIEHLSVTKKRKKELNEMYISATHAFKEGDVVKLLEIGSDLFIEQPNPSKKDIKLLEEYCTHKVKEINNLENSVVLSWYDATEDMKLDIFKKMAKVS